MISTASLFILCKKLRNILFKRNFLDLGYFAVMCGITFIPLGASLIYYYNCNSHLSVLENQLLRLRERYKTLQDCEKRRENYKNLYLKADSSYLQNITSVIIPLQDEIEFLKKIIPFYPPEYSSDLKKRLHFLKSENRLKFHEITRTKNGFLDEITIQQINPIELNIHDLQHILFQLEGISNKNTPTMLLGRPQILISHLDISKEKDSDRGTFTMKLNLIQREVKP